MRALGIIVLMAGIALCIYALKMDTGAVVDYTATANHSRKTGVLPAEGEDANGRIEERKTYLVFAGILSIAGLIVAVFARKHTESQPGEHDDAWLVEQELDKQMLDTDDTENDNNVHSTTDTLLKLNELWKDGALTDEEFRAQKEKLLRGK